MISSEEMRWAWLLRALVGAWVFSQTVLCPLRADEARLLGILTNAAASTDASSTGETPTSLAKGLIQKFRDTEPSETVTHVDRDGTATTEERTPANPSALHRIVTPSEEAQILEVLNQAISEREFVALPAARQQEILAFVEMDVKRFCGARNGPPVTALGKKAALDVLSLNIRTLKNVPVVSVEKPDLIARQLSLLVRILVRDAVSACGQPISSDSQIYSEIEQRIEDQFCNLASETGSVAFKRALPEAAFHTLSTNLEALIARTPHRSFETWFRALRIDTNAMTTTNVSAYLDKGNRRRSIAEYAAQQACPPALPFIANHYTSNALSSRGFAHVDFSGGIPEAERRRVGQEMMDSVAEENEQIKELQTEKLRQSLQDITRRVADSRLKRSGRAFGDPNWDLNEVHNAIRDGNLEKIKSLLKDNPDGPVKRDAFGYTPLHYAAAFGEPAVAELLLTNGADVNAQALDGATPLYWAVEEGHKNLVELLLTYHAEVDAKNKNGRTPLDIAQQIGRNDLLELLKAHSAPRTQPMY